jgi:hypothetical protein
MGPILGPVDTEIYLEKTIKKKLIFLKLFFWWGCNEW